MFLTFSPILCELNYFFLFMLLLICYYKKLKRSQRKRETNEICLSKSTNEVINKNSSSFWVRKKKYKNLLSFIIYSLPSSVMTITVELGPSPSGLKTWIETTYCVKVSRYDISWVLIMEKTKLKVKISKIIFILDEVVLCFVLFPADRHHLL